MSENKKLSPFEKIGLLEINKELKQVFEGFFADAEIVSEFFTEPPTYIENTLVTTYKLPFVVDYKFLDKDYSCLVKIGFNWDIKIIDNKLVFKFWQNKLMNDCLTLDEEEELFEYFKEKYAYKLLINNVNILFKSKLDALHYDYEIYKEY